MHHFPGPLHLCSYSPFQVFLRESNAKITVPTIWSTTKQNKTKRLTVVLSCRKRTPLWQHIHNYVDNEICTFHGSQLHTIISCLKVLKSSFKLLMSSLTGFCACIKCRMPLKTNFYQTLLRKLTGRTNVICRVLTREIMPEITLSWNALVLCWDGDVIKQDGHTICVWVLQLKSPS